MNRFAGQKLRHRCREQTYGHQGGKVAGGGGGGVMNWEIGIDIYTLIFIKCITNKNMLYKKKILNFKKKNTKKPPTISLSTAALEVRNQCSMPLKLHENDF